MAIDFSKYNHLSVDIDYICRSNFDAMIQFQCDYNEGAHPRILERLVETNFEQTVGYGEDSYCSHARDLIRKACNAPDADVHFLVGGTQTNTTVITSILRPHQGVLCAHTGHINVHETGAIEHGGHKVLSVYAERGLLLAGHVRHAMEEHNAEDAPEHAVKPGMVYVSFPSEIGTVYTLEELEALSEACHEYSLPLYIDGARLGYGLASEGCDLSLADIARLADVFYIGGTKQGTLFGEAVVILNDSLKTDFRYLIKQGGGLLAKGRLLGLQFAALFEDDLYHELSRHAITQAMRIKEALISRGYSFIVDSFTNQQFPILPNEVADRLSKDFKFSVWNKVDESHTAVRLCTSWATRPESVDALIAAL